MVKFRPYHSLELPLFDLFQRINKWQGVNLAQ